MIESRTRSFSGWPGIADHIVTASLGTHGILIVPEVSVRVCRDSELLYPFYDRIVKYEQAHADRHRREYLREIASENEFH